MKCSCIIDEPAGVHLTASGCPLHDELGRELARLGRELARLQEENEALRDCSEALIRDQDWKLALLTRVVEAADHIEVVISGCAGCSMALALTRYRRARAKLDREVIGGWP